MEQWTIQKLLNWTADYFTKNDVDSPRLSAEMLLSNVLELQRIELYTNFDQSPTRPQLDELHVLVKRASEHEPVAYLISKTEFYSLDIKVTSDCLIPRPETETLVEKAVDFLRARGGRQFVLDLCTGSGCIAIAIAKNCPDSQIIATDISDPALAVAAENIASHHFKERIELLSGDLFGPIIAGLDNSRFDLIVCNPPYVTASEFDALDKNVKDYEPKDALLAGADGLDIYRRIVEKVDDFLKPDAAVMLETGYAQGQAVRELLEKAGCFGEIKIEKDRQNNDRIAIAKKRSSPSDS